MTWRYRVGVSKGAHRDEFVGDVEQDQTVLLRNYAGSLDEVSTAIGSAIRKHQLDPWNALEKESGSGLRDGKVAQEATKIAIRAGKLAREQGLGNLRDELHSSAQVAHEDAARLHRSAAIAAARGSWDRTDHQTQASVHDRQATYHAGQQRLPGLGMNMAFTGRGFKKSPTKSARITEEKNER